MTQKQGNLSKMKPIIEDIPLAMISFSELLLDIMAAMLSLLTTPPG
jgi:hypothetical protein